MPTGVYKRTEYHKNKISKAMKINFSKGYKVWNDGLKGYGSGISNSMWKGGIIIKNGYRMILNHEHPFKNSVGYVYEHRLIMERHIGRYLKRNEVIHHINRIKDDNRIENLKLLNNSSDHGKIHVPKGSLVGYNS